MARCCHNFFSSSAKIIESFQFYIHSAMLPLVSCSPRFSPRDYNLSSLILKTKHKKEMNKFNILELQNSIPQLAVAATGHS